MNEITRDQPTTIETREEIAAPEYLEFAVIQRGYCVFGAGATAEDAIQDALEWVDLDDDGDRYTAESLRSECLSADRIDGSMAIIERDDDECEFDSYMRNQGAFRFDGTGWLLAE